jgi:arylsulfatase A-like enzyme
MRWPGRIPAGTTCNQIAGNIDMLPTFAKLTGTVPPQDRVLDGRDITSLLFKADAPAVRDTHLYFTRASKLGAIRQGEWKLFLTDQKKPSFEKPSDPKAEVRDGTLFDLAKDPYETTDVAAAHPDIVTKLRAEAQKREKEIEEHRRPAGTL